MRYGPTLEWASVAAGILATAALSLMTVWLQPSILVWATAPAAAICLGCSFWWIFLPVELPIPSGRGQP